MTSAVNSSLKGLKSRSSRDHSQKLTINGVKYLYGIWVVGEWNEIISDVSVDSIHEIKRLYDSRKCSRDWCPYKCRASFSYWLDKYLHRHSVLLSTDIFLAFDDVKYKRKRTF